MIGLPFSGYSCHQSVHLSRLGLATIKHGVGVRAPAVQGAIFTSFALCLVTANLAFDYHVWMCVYPFFSIPGGRRWSVNECATFLQFSIPRFLLGVGAPGRPDEGSLGTQTSSADFISSSSHKPNLPPPTPSSE